MLEGGGWHVSQVPYFPRFVLSGYTCHILPRRDGSRELSNPENDKEAISVGDICTVVSGGVMNWASRMSSNPMTDKSRGILRERSNAARITPMAVSEKL